VHAATAGGAILSALRGVGVVEEGAEGGARSAHTLHDCAAVCALASRDRVVKHGTCTHNTAM
jgi:hypothetical protein